MSVGDDEPVDGASLKENGDEYCLEKSDFELLFLFLRPNEIMT